MTGIDTFFLCLLGFFLWCVAGIFILVSSNPKNGWHMLLIVFISGPVIWCLTILGSIVVGLEMLMKIINEKY